MTDVPVEVAPHRAPAPSRERAHVERIATRKLLAFCGTIDEEGEYLDAVHKQNRSLSQHIIADYHGRFLIELVQNAHDAHARGRRDGEVAVVLASDEGESGVLYVANRGRPFGSENVDALCEMGLSSKPPGEAVGNKGLGFRSVRHVTDCPQVFSRLQEDSAGDSFDGYCFTFARDAELDPLLPDERKRKLAKRDLPAFYIPRWIEDPPAAAEAFAAQGFSTVIRLPLRNGGALEAVRAALAGLVDTDAPMLLFLPRLRRLEARIEGERLADHRLSREFGRRETPVEAGSGLHLVDLGPSGRFWVARAAIPAAEMRAAVTDGLQSGALPENWAGWKGPGEVALAVPLEDKPAFNPRLYTFLPMGRGATAPFHGHLHGSFFPSSNRMTLDPTIRVNALVLEHAVRLAAESARWLMEWSGRLDGGVSAFEAAKGAVDLLVWSTPASLLKHDSSGAGQADESEDSFDLGQAVSVEIARAWSVRILADAPCVPCLGDGGAEVQGTEQLIWRSPAQARRLASEGGTFNVRALARHGAAFGVAPMWPDLGQARAERLVAFLRARAVGRFADWLTRAERAQFVEAVAVALASRPGRVRGPDWTPWLSFYRELPGFVDSDAASLAGRRLLICQDGSLRATRKPVAPGPGDARARRRREPREAAVFMPPRRGEEDGGIGEEFYPPASVRDYFAVLQDALPWYAELSAARQFLEKDLVSPFESEALLTRISQIVEEDGTKKVKLAALRWAFNIWRRSVAVKRPVSLGANYRLHVPTQGGDFIRATEAVFSPGWPERTLGHQLQQFLEVAPPGCEDLEDLKARRLANPEHAAFGTRHRDEWATFLEGLGVQRGLEPRTAETKTYTLATRVLSFDFLRDLGLPDAFGPLLRRDIQSRPELSLSLPTGTDYKVGPVWWLPGQADIDRFNDEALEAYARLVVAWIGRIEHKHLWTVVKHRHNHVSDSREWPTPLAAFLRSVEWLPCEEPGSDEHRRRRCKGREVWLATAGDRYPPFLRRPSYRFSRALDRAPDEAIGNLRRAAGLRTFNARESLLEQLDFLAQQFGDGCVRRFYERELVNLYNRSWTRLADELPGAPFIEKEAAPARLLVRRRGQLGLAKVRGTDAELVYVRDTGDAIAASLVEVIGEPLLDVRGADPGRVGGLLQRLYGRQVRRTSELVYDIHVGGTPLQDLPAGRTLVAECLWLRPMLAASLEALDSVELNRLPADRSAILRALDRIEVQVQPSVAFKLQGRDVTPTERRAAYRFQRADGAPLIVIVGNGELTWTMIEAALPAVSEAIGHAGVAPHMKLLARQLRFQDAIVGDRSIGQPDLIQLCQALDLNHQAVEAARDSLGERADRLLPWYRAIVWQLGGDAAFCRWHEGEAQVLEDASALLDLLRASLPAGSPNADEVANAARGSFSLGELRERLGLDFAGFNESLVATGSAPDVDPEGQQSQLDHYIEDHSVPLLDALRNMAAPRLLNFDAEPRYKAACDDLARLKPDSAWLQRYERIPEDQLAAYVGRWLGETGAPALGENPQGLADLSSVRTSNAGRLKGLVRTAQPLVRTWGIQTGGAAPETWVDPAHAEAELRRGLENAGAFDCRAWTEQELLRWFETLGLWPAQMPLTLDREQLGIAETELEAEANKARRERERREREARSVRINGELRDPQAIDWLELSREVSSGLSRKVLTQPISAFTDLAPVRPAGRRAPAGQSGGAGGAFRGVPQEKKDMIGRLGELSVYHWLKARLPNQDIDRAWVSGNAGLFVGREGNDSLGYDFRVRYNNQTWFIEVKASTEDPCQFEMGETEVRFARDVARSRRPERYVIAYVANVGQTQQTTIDLLPNPLSVEADGRLNIAGDSVRYTFRREG